MPPGEKNSCREGNARVWVADWVVVGGIGGSFHHKLADGVCLRIRTFVSNGLAPPHLSAYRNTDSVRAILRFAIDFRVKSLLLNGLRDKSGCLKDALLRP